MLRPIVAGQGREDLGIGVLAEGMLEGQQLLWVALAGEDRLDDTPSGHSGDVAEHLMYLQVHLLERLLLALDLLGTALRQALAMTPVGAQLYYIGRREEAAAQETKGMELAQPARVPDVALASGHVTGMAGIHERDLETGVLEHLVDWDPIDARRLQDDGTDPTLLKPDGHLLQVGGSAAEGAHTGSVSVLGNGDIMGLRADVNAGGVGLEGI